MLQENADFDLLQQKANLTSTSELNQIFNKTNSMKLEMAQSLKNFRTQIENGKLPGGYTPIVKYQNKQKEQTQNIIKQQSKKHSQKKADVIQKQYRYRLKFQQGQKQQKNSPKQQKLIQQMISKQQKSKQALLKLTTYNIPSVFEYQKNQIMVSQIQSQTSSMKLIAEDDNFNSGFNLRKQIFKQLAPSGSLEKLKLVQFLQKHKVVCRLYNVPEDGDISCYVTSIVTENPVAFNQIQFHHFLTSKHRIHKIQCQKQVCVLTETQWNILRSIYEALDTFGSNKVVGERIIQELKKRYESLNGKLFMKDCVFYPSVQKYISFGRVWERIVNSETNPIWSWEYMESLFTNFNIALTVPISESKYNHSFARVYNFLAPFQFLDRIKLLFQKQYLHYDLYASKESIYHSIKSDPSFQDYSNLQIRTNQLHGLRVETVGEALERFNQESDDFVDLDEILIYFSFNGMFDEDIHKYKLSLFDKNYSQELVFKKKNLQKKCKKKVDITVPIEFNFTAPKKVQTIRQKKLQQMLKDRQEKQMIEVNKKFKALDVPITNDCSYNLFKSNPPKSTFDRSCSQKESKSKIYHQTTLHELKTNNQNRKSKMKKQTLQKYGMVEQRQIDKQNSQALKSTLTIQNKSLQRVKSTTIPHPFNLSKTRQKKHQQQVSSIKVIPQDIQSVIEKMKVPVKIPLTTKCLQQFELQKAKFQQQDREKKQKIKQQKWKQLRRRQFYKYMRRSLPKVITTEIGKWRDHQIKKEFKQIQKRLALQNEQQITQMYKRVLQKPFLFQMATHKNGSESNKMKKQPKKKTIANQPKHVHYNPNQFINSSCSKQQNYESTTIKKPFSKTIDPRDQNESICEIQQQSSIVDQSKICNKYKIQELMEESNMLEKCNDVESYQEEQQSYQQDHQQDHQQDYQQDQQQHEHYSDQYQPEPMRHSF